jgi:rhomboid protease GluP
MGKDNRRQPRRAGLHELWRHAPVTACLIATNIAVFGAMVATGFAMGEISGEDAVRWGSDYAPLVADGQWWRLVSSTFVHLSLPHIAVNMYALYQGGRVTERLFGSLRFVLLYFYAGVVGNMVSEWWNPAVNGAGASGAIFGIFGALAVFMARRHWRTSAPALQPAGISLLVFAIYSLLSGFTNDRVDNVAHVGGLLGGMAMGVALARPLNLQPHARIRLGQLIVACMGGATVLAVLAWSLVHPSPPILAIRQFHHLLEKLHAREVAAIAANEQVDQRIETEKLTAAAYADALEHEVLPPWQSLYRDTAAITALPPGRDRTAQQLLLRYLGDRRDAVIDTIDSNRHDDPRRLDAANAKNADADDAISQLKKLSGWE